MDLFLVHNNPSHTSLVSSNGVIHYHISTTRVGIAGGGVSVTRIQRPIFARNISTLRRPNSDYDSQLGSTPSSPTAGGGEGTHTAHTRSGSSGSNGPSPNEAGPSCGHRARARIPGSRSHSSFSPADRANLIKASVIAEIEWKSWNAPNTTLRSAVLGPVLRDAEMRYRERKKRRSPVYYGISRGRGKDKGKEKEECPDWDEADGGDSGSGTSEGKGKRRPGFKRRGRSWSLPMPATTTIDGLSGKAVPVDSSDSDDDEDTGGAPPPKHHPTVGIQANKLLYRKGQFSSSRYFMVDDGREFRWKNIKGSTWALLPVDQTTSAGLSSPIIGLGLDTPPITPLAVYTTTAPTSGPFSGSRKAVLRISPGCSIDINLVVLTWVIMEKKRKAREGDGTKLAAHDEEVQGEGGADGGVGGEGGGA